MNFSLQIIDKNRNLINVANVNIASFNIDISDILSDTIVLPSTLYAGNTYRLTFPATSVPLSLGIGETTITSIDDVSINLTITNAILLNGGFVEFTPLEDINNLEISVLSDVGEYNETIVLSGEGITIIVNDGNSVQIFQNANQINPTLVNNSNVTLTVQIAGYFEYNNTFTVFTENVEATVMMIQQITDINNAEYMQPFANFFIIQDPCSFNVYAIDGTNFPFGNRRYFINNEIDPFATTRNGTVEVCTPGNYTIRQEIYTLGRTTGCGQVTIPPYEVDYSIDIEVLEYRPNFILNRGLDCCLTINEEVNIYLSSLNLNNTVTGCATANLEIEILSPSLEQVGIINYDYNDIVTLETILEELNILFTPTELGTYTIKVTLENCCTETIEEFKVDVCSSWIVENKECNVITITNKSTINPINYTLKKLEDKTFNTIEINSVLQENIELREQDEIEIDLNYDGLYTITIGDNEYIFLLDCNLRKCKEKLLVEVLCTKRNPCKCTNNCGCDETKRLNLIEFTQLANLVYRKWNYWRLTQNYFNTLDINAIIDRAILINDAMKKIATICKNCNALKDKDDCGC